MTSAPTELRCVEQVALLRRLSSVRTTAFICIRSVGLSYPAIVAKWGRPHTTADLPLSFSNLLFGRPLRVFHIYNPPQGGSSRPPQSVQNSPIPDMFGKVAEFGNVSAFLGGMWGLNRSFTVSPSLLIDGFDHCWPPPTRKATRCFSRSACIASMIPLIRAPKSERL
jgi:hypothetical protein